jgi:hypothetical protein
MSSFYALMHVPGCNAVVFQLMVPKNSLLEPDAERTSARGAFKFALTNTHVMTMYAHAHSIATKV